MKKIMSVSPQPLPDKWDTSLLLSDKRPAPSTDEKIIMTAAAPSLVPFSTLSLIGVLFVILLVLRPPVLSSNEDDELSFVRCTVTAVTVAGLAQVGSVFF